MSNAPIFEININEFWENPYPQLKYMRENHPICYVPQLKSTLFTKRDSNKYEKICKIPNSQRIQSAGLDIPPNGVLSRHYQKTNFSYFIRGFGGPGPVPKPSPGLEVELSVKNE